MYRIGIIGAENYHAECFCRIFNLKNRHPDFRVTMVWGQDPKTAQRLVDSFGAETVAQSVEEMVDAVDAVMVTARDGKFHYAYVKPFLEKGIPAFVDKPFTVDIQEAVELINLVKSNHVPVCGGSSLKFCDDIPELRNRVEKYRDKVISGTVSAPIVMESEYSGFFFYASHLVEMMLEIFGYDPKSVTAVRCKNGVVATVQYDDYSVSNHFNEGTRDYSVCVYKPYDGIYRVVDPYMAEERECDDFVHMVKTGQMHQSYEKLVMPVVVMNAIQSAYETGGCVLIQAPV